MSRVSGGIMSQAGDKVKAEAQCVRIRRDGSLLAIRCGQQAADVLSRLLTYGRVKFLRGYQKRLAGVDRFVESVKCFERWTDKTHGVLPETILTAAGYLELIEAELGKQGFVVSVKDVTPRRPVFVPHWEALKNVEFRWKQREVLESMLLHDYGRYDCPVGWGKSLLIRCFCQLLPKARIDVTTHSVDVIRQIYEDLAGVLPDVGIFGGGKRDTGHRVMCYSGKSLHHSDAQADVLIVDECHEMATDDYLGRIARYRYARRYGFSATHDMRVDQADFELLGVFGPVRLSVPYHEAVRHDCVVPIHVWWRKVEMPINPCAGITDDTARARRGLWRNETRNRIIAQAAREFDEDEQVLIVVSTVEHAMHLKKLLPEFTLCYGEGSLSPDERRRYIREGCIAEDEPVMTAQRRYELKQAFSDGRLKKVIATGVWNRGVDFRALQVLIRADGQCTGIADMQIPGRVSRKSDETGKQFSVVVDFVDKFDQFFHRKAMARRRHYVQAGWKQIGWG